jgi:hypothetical protein
MTTQWALTPAAPPRTPSRTGAVVLVVAGSLLALMTIGFLAGGGFLMWADQTQRDASGYLTSGTGNLSAPSYAIATSSVDLNFSGRAWPVDQNALGKVRITAASASPAGVFIGIAPRADALRYLNGVAYDGLSDLQFLPYRVTYTPHDGGAPAVPTAQTFWQAQASGGGTQTLTWTVAPGQWIVVLMNADGSQGIASDVSIGATAPFLFALALGLLIAGGVALVVAVVLLGLGIRLLNGRSSAPLPAGVPLPPPVPTAQLSYPLRVEGRLDEPLSRWLWLVKWVLLIPHFIVLWFLFVTMFVLTVIAFFAILITGRYPRAIFDFNVGVLRWAWRVGFYGYSALGTDRYPPFTFAADADYPATLDVPYPEHLSRGLLLIKWWLLAIPQYIIVAVLAGGVGVAVHLWGLIAVLTLIAAFALLFTSRYPRGIFDFVMGLNRWVFRVLVYVLLMRDEYPPFRFDPGGGETPPVPSAPPAPWPGVLPVPPPV